MRGLMLVAVLAAGCGEAKREGGSFANSQPKPQGGSPDPAPEVAAKPSPVRPVKVGGSVDVGDLSLKIMSAKVTGFLDDQDNSHTGLVVEFAVTCTNPKRIATVPAQAGRARMTDDVGNTYQENLVAGRFGDAAGLLWDRIRHKREVRLQSSGGPLKDAVIFEKPVEGAARVTVDLDASAYGGGGVIRLELTRAEFGGP